MTFEKLGDDRVLITLRYDDIKTLGLDFEKLSINNPEDETKLRKLLLLALLDTGIDSKGRRFLLEALPFKTGYLLLVHAQRVHRRKRYRVKRQCELPACFFENENDLLDALGALSGTVTAVPANTLYLYHDRYCLLFSYPVLPKNIERILYEYGSLKTLDPISLSVLREHGSALVSGNALSSFEK